MTTGQDSAIPSGNTPENAAGNWKLSLDWWAVIFSLVLAFLVLIGLQVTW